jgi:twinkle protein
MARPELENGTVVGRKPCYECHSRDNVAIYDNGGEHCFTPGCSYHIFGDGSTPSVSDTYRPSKLEMSGVVRKIPDRKLSVETCARFGVTVSQGADGVITHHYYPYYDKVTKDISAVKKRICATKDMPWSGDRSNVGLFGQNLCSGRGKYITVTEGEIDAMAVAEMFDNKWDVVSLRDGAQSAKKDIVRELEFLEGYDNVIICFDEDEHGRKAWDDVKDVFSPNKVKKATLPLKDAGALLAAGRVRDFTKSWWDAKSYQPQGIVKVSETWDEVLKYRDTPSLEYPWGGLNDILQGQRRKEIVVWAAETGIGKSQTMREIQHDIISRNPDETVGCLMLEESVAKTTLGWMSFMAERPLHKELKTIPDEELRKYWEMATKGDRMVLLDHKGWQNNLDTLLARIRYMKHSMGCNWIVLDHLHIALSSVEGASGDWSGIDELMTNFVGMVHELDIGLHLVCHTSGERSLRGSKGISKLADAVIFLERDKHHNDPEVANTTEVVVDKNRWAGDVGTACYLKYSKETNRMTECPPPAATQAADEEF